MANKVEEECAAVLGRRVTEALGKRQCRRTQQYETGSDDRCTVPSEHRDPSFRHVLPKQKRSFHVRGVAAMEPASLMPGRRASARRE